MLKFQIQTSYIHGTQSNSVFTLRFHVSLPFHEVCRIVFYVSIFPNRSFHRVSWCFSVTNSVHLNFLPRPLLTMTFHLLFFVFGSIFSTITLLIFVKSFFNYYKIFFKSFPPLSFKFSEAYFGMRTH